MRNKVLESEANMLNRVTIPKEMSNWLDFNIKHGNFIPVEDDGSAGFVIKSLNCTIAFFPNWNCDEQVGRIAKKLDDDSGETYY